MYTSIKTQIKLTSSPEILIARNTGYAKFTNNWGLATWSQLYKDGYKFNALLKKFFNNVQRLQYQLQRKSKGYSQYVARIRVAKNHQEFANIRKDSIPKATNAPF